MAKQFEYPEAVTKQYVKRPLKTGELVTYRLLGVKPDPEPMNRGRLLGPSYQDIKSSFLVDGEDGKVYEISYGTKQDKDGNIVRESVAFRKTEGLRITVNGSNPKDRLLYEFLEMHPQNAKNSERNNTIAVFEREDEEAVAATDMENFSTLSQAIEAFNALSYSQISGIAEARGLDISTGEARITKAVKDFAMSFPNEFLKVAGGKGNNYIDLVKAAEKKRIIFMDLDVNAWKWSDSGDIILQFKRKVGQSKYQVIAEFLAANPETKDLLEKMV